jgi:hypothetical protein
MENDEKYICGVTSGHLKKGLLEGYAIHVTTKRIIGVKRSGYGLVAGGIFGSKSVEHEREEESKLEGNDAGEEMKNYLNLRTWR